jgi:hypothetical protein
MRTSRTERRGDLLLGRGVVLARTVQEHTDAAERFVQTLGVLVELVVEPGELGRGRAGPIGAEQRAELGFEGVVRSRDLVCGAVH